MTFGNGHLLSIGDLTREEIVKVLDTAEAFHEVARRPVRKVPTLRGKSVMNLFFEASTRTRTSFELAGKRLSADVINMSMAASSLKKGESLLDTCKTLGALHPHVVIVRHGASGAPQFMSENLPCSVINAGDGTHEHPTQALLDAFTIRRQLGRLEGLKVAICGDIAHSRVARSNLLLLNQFGCEVRLAGPRTLMPPAAEELGARVFDRLEPALQGVDVVMMLRIQQERLEGALIPSMREYNRFYALTAQRLAAAKSEAIVMHPGPINRGVEIDPAVADGPRSVILNQVEAGLAVRMAVLYLLAGEESLDEASN